MRTLEIIVQVIVTAIACICFMKAVPNASIWYFFAIGFATGLTFAMMEYYGKKS